jgi:hypothetical protein
MSNFLVSVDFSVTNDDDLYRVPSNINKHFELSKVIEAVDYFNSCVNYFTGAAKYDLGYRGITINVSFFSDAHDRVIEIRG